jgi:hypothetical protein
MGAEIEEFNRFVATHADERTAPFVRVSAAFREYVPAESCGPEIERRVQQCVAQGRAASFLRLGDGEGNLLALGLDTYPALTAYCAREISVMHFGAADVLLEAGPELHQGFHTAIRNAEVVGFPGPWVMPLLLRQRGEGSNVMRPIYGVGTVYAYLERFADELGLAHKMGSSAAFSRRLLPHYRGMIEHRDIGLVSCQDKLPDALRQRMGARSVAFYPVPEQANTATTSRSADTGHYPDRYHPLLEELRGARPGIVYFVAAGMLGKIYCEVIRAAGGIALDIGAVADIWAGVRSRRRVRPETLEQWRVL